MGVFRKGHLVRVESLFTKLAPSEQKVAMSILKDPPMILEMGITELAKFSGSSEAAVVRFCKKAGFTGFKQFKVAMVQELGSMPFSVPKKMEDMLEGNDDLRRLSDKILEAHTSYLKASFAQVNLAQVESAAKKIVKSRKIAIFATGLSSVVASELNNRLMRLRLDTQYESSSYAQYMQASKLTPEDMAIGISFSGTTKEIVDSITLAKEMGAATLAITNYPAMPLGQLCNFVISPEIGQGPMDIGMWAIPRVVGLAVVDLLMGVVALNMEGSVEEEAETSRQAILFRLGI